MREKKEEYIEQEILAFFIEKGCKCVEKNIVSGFYNANKGFYQKNKSTFVKTGRSDIQVFHKGKLVVIEVKRKSEMSFFDRPLEELRLRYAEALYRVKDPKRYLHSVEQREYLDEIIKQGGIGFFASSVDEVREKLGIYNFRF